MPYNFVELFAMLCKEFGLDSLADGVVISHAEGHKSGIASNHGDPEHLWRQLGLAYTMDGFRKEVRAAVGGVSAGMGGYTRVMGKAVASVGQMRAYLKEKNPEVAQSVLDMVPLYISEGEAEGVRGDVAFAQSCLETGNFTFTGSAVTVGQNNFCGMGVASNGVKGNSFDTPQLGIRAQVQHLKAYASKGELENACVDPRFRYVVRGCAEYVEWLGQKENPDRKGWAAGKGYGGKILGILDRISGITDAVGHKEEFKPYRVRVSIPDLNIRRGPGTNHVESGRYTGVGIFTVIEEADGVGASRWGLLKAYREQRDGWISLDYAEKV